MAIDVLKQLDERIQVSVSVIGQLRRENQQLMQKLQESERRFTQAQAQLTQLNAERQQHEQERIEVRTRIERILARFDGIDLT
jgi:FtsZ-binding cell division protein ZapB